MNFNLKKKKINFLLISKLPPKIRQKIPFPSGDTVAIKKHTVFSGFHSQKIHCKFHEFCFLSLERKSCRLEFVNETGRVLNKC